MIRATSITVLAVASLAAAADVVAQSRNQPAVLGGQGRYVFGQINEFNADQYMLDTRTGRLWRLVDTADGSNSVLEAVPYALPGGRSQPTPPDADDLVPPAPVDTDLEALLPLPVPQRQD